ncbi:hypothetical protein PENSPDRAFT_328206 [Peniophora sp. CONT]|nr:hypothetical protein PENSPDRAFT_328206 [Peniophora sp. CONT]
MGQYFQLLNLTLRQVDPCVEPGTKFQELAFNWHWGMEKFLREPIFPSEPPEIQASLTSNPPRSHLGLLGILPSELIDLILLHLDLSVDVLRLSAVHYLLNPHCFTRLVNILRQSTKRVWWSGNQIALVGDYLRNPPAALLPDDLRSDLQSGPYDLDDEDSVPNEGGQPVRLYEFASRHFTNLNANLRGSLLAYETKLYRPDPAHPRKAWQQMDIARAQRMLNSALPNVPEHIHSPVLCNLTQRQLVRSEAVEKVKTYHGGTVHVTLGSVAIFLVVCTDDWSFSPWYKSGMSDMDLRFGGIFGGWAGDRLTIMSLENVEEGFKDISGEVVELISRFFGRVR